MNKYQEALDCIKEIVIDEHADGYYQPRTVGHYYPEAIDNLNELVKKSTSKKPIVKYDNFGDGTLCCPNCNQSIVNVWSKRKYRPKYCHYCGQVLDWGEEQ